MVKGSSAVRRVRVLRWLLIGGLSYVVAMFLVLIGFSPLPEDTQMSVSDATAAWAVPGLAVVLGALFAWRIGVRRRR